MDPSLTAILLRDNPWLGASERLQGWLDSRLPGRLIRRQVLGSAGGRWTEPGRAHLVVGPRQAGKSTLLWAHLAAQSRPALLVDCEQALVREWCTSAPLFLADLEQLVPAPVTLLFEEVQHLGEAGLFLKGIVDRRYPAPVLVTGSSSYHFGARTRESLAGRATRTRLLPLSLDEITADLSGSSPALRTRESEERLQRHLRFGGYPAVWLDDRPELLLADLVEAVILRDASDLFRIARPDVFRRLLRLLAGQVGNLVNLTEWASIVGASRDTVASYLEILESSHVVVTVPPFAGGRRAELTSRPKLFLVDTGIRNQLVNDFRPLAERADRGPLLESWVLGELLKAAPGDATIHFWRSSSGAEVDFVVARGEALVGVEVKASPLRRPTLPRSARSFVDAYQPRLLAVLNTALDQRERLGSTDVAWVTPAHLATELAAAMA